jgi:hypothetical protein
LVMKKVLAAGSCSRVACRQVCVRPEVTLNDLVFSSSATWLIL